MEKLVTPFAKNHFFGYYDKSPLNYSKKLLLSHEVVSVGKKIKKNDKAIICVTTLENGKIQYIEDTFTWNYQQGSQLQWLSDDIFIFNSYEKKYISKVYNLKKNKIDKILDFPIYSFSSDHKIFSTINYSRIHKFREGYGYLNKPYEKDESLLKICSFENSKILAELTKNDFKAFPEINLNSCWIDHILFSPNSYDFTFLLRFQNSNSSLLSYLFFFNFDNKKLFKVLDTGMAGHGSWINNKNFIIWGRKKKLIKKINNINNSFIQKITQLIRKVGVPNFLRENLYGDKYLNFNKHSKTISELNYKIPMNISGGHFSFLNNNLMISDTYHNENNESDLFTYKIREKKIVKIKKFHCLSEIRNKSYRCDLHPRIISEKELIIDSTHEGFRGIYIIQYK